MDDFSTTVLEGMIHNIRNPLNLIMAYAQQLQKLDRTGMGEKIYNATIKIDNIMQDTCQAMLMRNPAKEKVLLNSWLKAEVILLNCILAIKHRYFIEVVSPETEVYAPVSTLQLSLWLETLLTSLDAHIPPGQIRLALVLTILDCGKPTLQLQVKCPGPAYNSACEGAMAKHNKENPLDLRVETKLTDTGFQVLVIFDE